MNVPFSESHFENELNKTCHTVFSSVRRHYYKDDVAKSNIMVSTYEFVFIIVYEFHLRFT